MENIPMSFRLCRTMDVLMKFEKSPKRLKSITQEAISNLIIRALWKNQRHSEASPTSPATAYILSTVEEELKAWALVLPTRVKEEILCNVSKLLISNLGSNTVGYKSQFHAYNPLPVLIASSFEVLYDPTFNALQVFNELQWNKESRGKVLHLIHRNLNPGVQHIDFACYKSPHYGLTSVPFSEKFILASCFNRLPNLRSLHLPNTCDDDILAKVADCCPLLEELDVTGSFGITNLGIQWFCTGTYNPNHLFHGPLPDNRKVFLQDPANRVGFQATPIIQFGQTISSKSVKKGQILASLKRANFTGTTMDSKGLELILTHCKELQKLVIDDEIWSSFFNIFDIKSLEGNDKRGGGFVPNGCLDCVGANGKMMDINIMTNVASYLPSILFLFPNLSHLTLAKPTVNADPEIMANLSECLSDFENQNSLTLKDVHFDHISPFLEGLGPRLTQLCFSGKSSSINMDHLQSTCPNLNTLSISYSTLTGNNHSNTGRRSIFQHLQNIKLWDIHSNDQQSWKKLIKGSPNLEKIFLWNIVILDEDIEDILKANALAKLMDIRIGASEIGFVKLTDETVIRLIKNCPGIKSIGGICDWKTRDLLTLLQNLMLEGGWKITLETQQPNSSSLQ